MGNTKQLEFKKESPRRKAPRNEWKSAGEEIWRFGEAGRRELCKFDQDHKQILRPAPAVPDCNCNSMHPSHPVLDCSCNSVHSTHRHPRTRRSEACEINSSGTQRRTVFRSGGDWVLGPGSVGLQSAAGRQQQQQQLEQGRRGLPSPPDMNVNGGVYQPVSAPFRHDGDAQTDNKSAGTTATPIVPSTLGERIELLDGETRWVRLSCCK